MLLDDTKDTSTPQDFRLVTLSLTSFVLYHASTPLPWPSSSEDMIVPVSLFADDTQLYLEFSPLDSTKEAEAMTGMESCVAMVRSWMHRNMLTLNNEKAELIVIHPRYVAQHWLPYTITTGNTQTEATNTARNTGMAFDFVFTLALHVANSYLSAYKPPTQHWSYAADSQPTVLPGSLLCPEHQHGWTGATVCWWISLTSCYIAYSVCRMGGASANMSRRCCRKLNCMVAHQTLHPVQSTLAHIQEFAWSVT